MHEVQAGETSVKENPDGSPANCCDVRVLWVGKNFPGKEYIFHVSCSAFCLGQFSGWGAEMRPWLPEPVFVSFTAIRAVHTEFRSRSDRDSPFPRRENLFKLRRGTAGEKLILSNTRENAKFNPSFPGISCADFCFPSPEEECAAFRIKRDAGIFSLLTARNCGKFNFSREMRRALPEMVFSRQRTGTCATSVSAARNGDLIARAIPIFRFSAQERRKPDHCPVRRKRRRRRVVAELARSLNHTWTFNSGWWKTNFAECAPVFLDKFKFAAVFCQKPSCVCCASSSPKPPVPKKLFYFFRPENPLNHRMLFPGSGNSLRSEISWKRCSQLKVRSYFFPTWRHPRAVNLHNIAKVVCRR